MPEKLARFIRSKSQPPASYLHQWRAPAGWRDTSTWTQATYWHHACIALGGPLAFTLRLRDDVEAAARAQPSAASWLLKRVAHQLQQSFDRRVDFWFVLENAKNHGRGLHLHGEIVLDTVEAPAARAAMRRAAGEWTLARQHQAHTHEDPDEGWVGYALTDDPWNNKRSRAASSRGFNGLHYAATQPVKALSQSLYDLDRRSVAAKSL